MSKIIKASQAGDQQAVAFAFDEVGAASCATLSDARRQAAQLLAQAETQASQLCREAEQHGRAAAQQFLDETVRCQADSAAHAVAAAVEEIQATKDQWLAHWERCALTLATAIAARVIRREVQRAPDVTLELVREALQLVAGSSEVQLYMHPDDLTALGTAIDRLVAELTQLGDVKLVADADITRGGCRVETRHGTVDQQIESQLARITQELS